MEPLTEPGIDLFAEDLPSMDEIKRLSEFVHSGEANQISFGEQVESNMSRTGQKACLAVGIGLYILGRNAEAVERLQKANDCKEKFLYLAFALRRTGEFDEAIENLQNSLDYEADKMSITLEKAATYRQNTITSLAVLPKHRGCMNRRWTITKQLLSYLPIIKRPFSIWPFGVIYPATKKQPLVTTGKLLQALRFT